ncbi:MAG TPA: glycosyltransferase [Caulobacteraceae bacterium]|jgi:O-antigen/teichoic acid export membrane protein/glycosyltransferase involved in cell wall biosynthesis
MATSINPADKTTRARGLSALLLRLIGDPGGLVRGSLSGAAMRMLEVLLGLASLTLLARSLGPGGLGVYALGMAVVMLVGFVHAGLPMLTAREVSIATAQDDPGRVKGMILFALGCTMASAAILAALSSTVLVTFFPRDSAALLWALGLLPAFALSSLASSTLAGLRRFVAGQCFDLIVRPGLFVLLLLSVLLGAPHWLTPSRAFMLQTVASAASALIAWVLVGRALPKRVRDARPVFAAGRWLRAALPMSITVGLQIAQASAALLFLGAFSSAAQVGAFRVAQRGGDIGGFGLTSVGFTAGPEIARLNATGEHARLQRVLHRAAIFAFAVAASVFVGYAIADQRLLRWVFGAGFERAYVPLLICTAAQMLNAFFGINGTVLVMCGRERMVTLALFVSVTVQVLASPFLIPALGSTGAALSLALSFLIWNVILWRAARTQLGVGTTVLDFPHPARSSADADGVDIAILLPSLTGGGMERVRLLLAAEFARRGYRVELAVLDATGDLADHVPDNVTIKTLPVRRLRDSVQQVAVYLRERQPRALLAGLWPLTSMAVVARLLAGTRTRLVLSDHSDWSHIRETSEGLRGLWVRLSTGLTYPFADSLVAISDGVAHSVSRISGVPLSRVHRISNPPTLSLDVGEEAFSIRWPDGDGPRLLTMGRLAREKDHATLLRALAIVRRTMPARLAILGTGPLRDELLALTRDLGLAEAVTMPGFDPYPVRWLQQTDLFVLSSKSEGFGNVLVEALSQGVPVVSTDCPTGPAEILDGGRYGTLCRVGDPEALAGAIKSALLTAHNREALIARSRAYTLEASVHQYLELLVPEDEAA